MSSTSPRHVRIGSLTIGNDLPLAIIAGPCAMESREHALEMAQALQEICSSLGVGLIYKSSFDKANRTSLSSARGIGMERALPIFAEIRESVGCPVLTDVHEAGQCAAVAEVVDVLQIPAFLCRQTDLLLAAAKTGAAINIKKGQFLAPWDMRNVAEKASAAGNDRVLLTERGVSFGYNTLVTDLRGLPIMAQTGYPVVFDATHLRAAAGRPGQDVRRPAGICSGTGSRSRFSGCRCRLHGGSPGSGQGAERRSEHGTAEAVSRPAGDTGRLR